LSDHIAHVMEGVIKMKKVKIVCTIGPACSTYEMLCSMAEAGMNVARFNFSHGAYEEHKARLDLVRKAEKEIGKPIATLLDTKGPEIRTGALKEGFIMLTKGQPSHGQCLPGHRLPLPHHILQYSTACIMKQFALHCKLFCRRRL
jgi:hypothetical protein